MKRVIAAAGLSVLALVAAGCSSSSSSTGAAHPGVVGDLVVGVGGGDLVVVGVRTRHVSRLVVGQAAQHLLLRRGRRVGGGELTGELPGRPGRRRLRERQPRRDQGTPAQADSLRVARHPRQRHQLRQPGRRRQARRRDQGRRRGRRLRGPDRHRRRDPLRHPERGLTRRGGPQASRSPSRRASRPSSLPVAAYAKTKGYKSLGVIFTNVQPLSTPLDGPFASLLAKDGIKLRSRAGRHHLGRRDPALQRAGGQARRRDPRRDHARAVHGEPCRPGPR